KAQALVIKQAPDDNGLLTAFEDLHLYCSNFPGQLAERLQEDFHFSYVFPGVAPLPAARGQIPPPDFVLNNEVNGELLLSEGNLSGLIELVDSFGVPVVNHPTKAALTTRDVSAKRLKDISGVVVPKTRRFSSVGKTCDALVQEIETQFNYPLI